MGSAVSETTRWRRIGLPTLALARDRGGDAALVGWCRARLELAFANELRDAGYEEQAGRAQYEPQGWPRGSSRSARRHSLAPVRGTRGETRRGEVSHRVSANKSVPTLLAFPSAEFYCTRETEAKRFDAEGGLRCGSESGHAVLTRVGKRARCSRSRSQPPRDFEEVSAIGGPPEKRALGSRRQSSLGLKLQPLYLAQREKGCEPRPPSVRDLGMTRAGETARGRRPTHGNWCSAFARPDRVSRSLPDRLGWDHGCER